MKNLTSCRPLKISSSLQWVVLYTFWMVEKLAKMESIQAKAPQVVIQPQAVSVQQERGGQQAGYAAALQGLNFAHLLSQGQRRNSVSVKRSVGGAERDASGNTDGRTDNNNNNIFPISKV